MKGILENLLLFVQKKDAVSEHVKRYLAYQFTVWFFHLLLISLVSFFHLILNHSLGTIAEWINERGWQLIILTKLSVMFLFLQFFSLKLQVIAKLKSFYQNGWMWPRSDFIIIAMFFFIALMALGKPQGNPAIIFELDNLIWAYLGVVCFFAVDFLFLILLNANFPLPRNKHLLVSLLHAATFYLGSRATFQYEITHVSLIFFFLFFLLLYLSMWRRENWTLPCFFLLLILAPISAFLGFDPVWQNQYSLFYFSDKISVGEFNLIVFLCILYLHWKKSREPEYVYRD